MIVKCDQCQTRFKIPDDKVTEKGVKVRCTRCSHTFRVARAPDPFAAVKSPGVAPLPPAPPPVDTDPFASFSAPPPPTSIEATRPGTFHEGIEASRSPAAGAPLQPVYSAQQDVPSGVFQQPTRVSEVPRNLLESRSIAQPGPLPLPSPVPPAAAFETPSRPLSDFEPTVPLTASFPDPFALDPFPTEPPLPAAPSSAAPVAASSLLGDLPPADDQDFEVFDGAFPGIPPAPEPSSVIVARVTGPYAAAPAARDEASAETRTAVGRPSGRPEDMGMVERKKPGAVRKTLGLVLNLGLASFLLVALVSLGTIYLNGGKLDASALSLEPIKALFAGAGDLVAVDVSNGLYDTRSGKPVFYVRGEVENRGDNSSPARVKVEIVDGALSVTQAEVRVGAAASPEELYLVGTDEDVAALGAKLDAKALTVKPGERQPFLVLFYEYPPQLADYRLKLTVHHP